MLHNHDSSIKKIWRNVQSILDWRRSIPISFHKDHRNLINDFIAKVVTYVLAWPNLCGLEIAVKIPFSQELRRRISPQQILSHRSHSETRINQCINNRFLRDSILSNGKCRL